MTKLFLFSCLMMVFGCTQKPLPAFVQDQPLDSIKHAFHELNHAKVAEMGNVGANDKSVFSLDFYFDTNDSLKAQRLSDSLEKRDYHVNRIHRSSRDQTLWVLSGSSNPVSMNEDDLSAWTDSMCGSGFHFDCAFVGWNPVSE